MIEFTSLSHAIEAATLVGLVLLEALALYVGYGALEQAVGPRIHRQLTGS
jgi:hypothetical protein